MSERAHKKALTIVINQEDALSCCFANLAHQKAQNMAKVKPNVYILDSISMATYIND